MKIAFTSKGADMDSSMDPRFGRSEYLLILDTNDNSVISFDNRAISKESHGAGPKTAQKIFDFGAQVLITGNGPGGNALSVLEKAGVEIYVGAGNMTVKEAFEAYSNKQLKTF
jgi:predicted Fe-Mo cluster-binding NifX family protein